MMDCFLVIFSNISEQTLQGTPSDGCFLKVFCYTEAITGKCQKSWSQKFEKFLKKYFIGVYIFFNFSEENHSTTDGFLRILWNVLEQLFQKTLPDDCFWEYLGEGCRSLNKNEGCSSSTLTGRDSVNKVYSC